MKMPLCIIQRYTKIGYIADEARSEASTPTRTSTSMLVADHHYCQSSRPHVMKLSSIHLGELPLPSIFWAFTSSHMQCRMVFGAVAYNLGISTTRTKKMSHNRRQISRHHPKAHWRRRYDGRQWNTLKTRFFSHT